MKFVKFCAGRASAWYTAISLLLLFLKLIANENGAAKISVISFLLIFPCAICFSAGDFLLKNEKLGNWKRLLHYLIFTMGFFLFLWLPSGNTSGFSGNLVALCLFSVFYLLCFLLFKFCLSRFLGKMEKKRP